jgi:hypothetical protein
MELTWTIFIMIDNKIELNIYNGVYFEFNISISIENLEQFQETLVN